MAFLAIFIGGFYYIYPSKPTIEQLLAKDASQLNLTELRRVGDHRRSLGEKLAKLDKYVEIYQFTLEKLRNGGDHLAFCNHNYSIEDKRNDIQILHKYNSSHKYCKH